GRFTLRAAGEFSPDPISFDGEIAPPGATVDVQLELKAKSQVAGTVFEPDGVTPVQPGPLRSLVVHYKSDEFVSFCSESSGGETSCVSIPQGIQETAEPVLDSGRFLFPLVNAGTFTLVVKDDSTGKIGVVHGSVKAGETADVSARLLGRADVTVKVLSSVTQQPIPGAQVTIEQLDFPLTEP